MLLEQENNEFHLNHLYAKEWKDAVELQLFSAAGALGIQRPTRRSILNPAFLPKQTVLIVVTDESSGGHQSEAGAKGRWRKHRMPKQACVDK